MPTNDELKAAFAIAERFSSIIHSIEANGYELTHREDRSWAAATAELERARAALSRSGEEAPQGWQPIETAPKDGSWFAICRAGEAGSIEVGQYDPYCLDKYVETDGGLFRKETEQIFDWRGFNNFHCATHWMPLPTPPDAEGDGE